LITIFDYGAGNLRSVQNALEHIGASFEVVRDADGLMRGSKIILPGVGHFGQMMRALDRAKVRETFRERLTVGIPFLGICLGLQALFEQSAEAPEAMGLGIFPGRVERFASPARVPHMGWSDVTLAPQSRLFPDSLERPFFYFAHSYFLPVCEGTAATCDYTRPFTAAFERENIFGVQFHPEKSGALGLSVLRRFIQLPH
jgi:imidazole glycerol phosphate synthase glutamine amidotransferase subunit